MGVVVGRGVEVGVGVGVAVGRGVGVGVGVGVAVGRGVGVGVGLAAKPGVINVPKNKLIARQTKIDKITLRSSAEQFSRFEVAGLSFIENYFPAVNWNASLLPINEG